VSVLPGIDNWRVSGADSNTGTTLAKDLGGGLTLHRK